MTTWAHEETLPRATGDAVRINARAFHHSDGSSGLTIIAYCEEPFTFRLLALPLDIDDLTDSAEAVEIQAFSSDGEGADFPAGAVTRTIIGHFGRYFVELTPSASAESWVNTHELG